MKGFYPVFIKFYSSFPELKRIFNKHIFPVIPRINLQKAESMIFQEWIKNDDGKKEKNRMPALRPLLSG
ncbi:MAG TPA: hypothetical protein DHO02_01275 [Syntrophaceae bacterium]|nr:hypothetical protein [Syntrophaceae bacterium]HCS76259.1 hypothetical protein [Syntrophaceae bacterium]HCX01052.1 hypothetical protein [Syntrophaceae bacterium]